MLIDSHCHLDFPEFQAELADWPQRMTENGVAFALCAGVTPEGMAAIDDLCHAHPRLCGSVGVHPDHPLDPGAEPSVSALVQWSRQPWAVAIGETGLDYYRLTGDLEWQRQRFRNHIRAARQSGLPLIIHTRAAAEDTLKIMEEEGAGEAGGVFHCFTERAAVAEAALAMGFYISFSGIVTFKSAKDLQEIARTLPQDRILVETDAPYLAPVPYRGKTNHPALVKHVADFVAQLRGESLESLAAATTRNFFQCFPRAKAYLGFHGMAA